MPTVHANGIDIWYEVRGSGPTLALSHGWLGPTEDWPPGVLEGLTQHLRVLVYDVRGHGHTSAPDDVAAYALPTYAQDLGALLDALDLDRVHIGGVSQGGMISAQFVADHPERARSLLLCDTSAGNGADEGPAGEFERAMQGYLEQLEQIATSMSMAELATFRDGLNRENDPHYFDYPVSPEERLAKNRRQHERMSVAGFVGTARAIRTRPDVSARIRALELPALVVGGEWDGFYPCSERDHALLAGSRFVRALRCGHASPDWRPEVFIASVTQFIADVEAGRDVAAELEL
ncbi:MAG: alpha/beta hydrolase [Dehalococcoidia bacterium]